MTWQLAGPDVDALALGAALLGGGGGGDTDDGGADAAAPAVTVADLADLPADARACAVAQIGAPLIGRERVPSRELAAAVDALAVETGTAFAALVALEIGGQNALSAATAARQTGLPLLDADLMGRALPRIDQTLLALTGAPTGPVALASPSGHVLVVRRAGGGEVESLVRGLLPSLGGRAAAALYPTTVGDLRGAGTAGSVRRATDLGAALLGVAPGPDAGERVAAALAPLGVQVVARGAVRHVERSGGRLVAAVVGPDGVVRLDADTEFDHCAVDGRPVAGSPDVIGVLDARTLRPVLATGLLAGTDVLVYRLPVAAPWYGPAGRALLDRGRQEVAA